MKFKIVVLSALLISGCSYYEAIIAPKPQSATSEQSLYKSTDDTSMSMTKAYEVAATRITNKMLDDTVDIYETKPNTKLYIKKIIKNSETLPDGFYSAQRTIKKIINGSATYTIVDKIDDADFVLESKVNELKNNQQSIIQFNMDIKDKQDNSVKAWSITIRQMAEDKSWW